MLVLPFLAIFICVYWAALGGIHFFQPNNAEGSTARRIFRPRLLAAVIAGFPVLLLVLQSIMELNQQDVILAFGIFVLAYVFVSKGLVSQGTSPERQ